jgi:hypothetical protein
LKFLETYEQGIRKGWILMMIMLNDEENGSENEEEREEKADPIR